MVKFNIQHTADNQEPNIYDLRNDLEGMDLEVINLFSNFNAILYEYFRINYIYSAKPINEDHISLLKEFKEKHLKTIEKAYQGQDEFITWFFNMNGFEPNTNLLGEENDKS